MISTNESGPLWLLDPIKQIRWNKSNCWNPEDGSPENNGGGKEKEKKKKQEKAKEKKKKQTEDSNGTTIDKLKLLLTSLFIWRG